eukprot:scaffold736_cov254-Pinguiococcus_pyrenoidosus.AAC.23
MPPEAARFELTALRITWWSSEVHSCAALAEVVLAAFFAAVRWRFRGEVVLEDLLDRLRALTLRLRPRDRSLLGLSITSNVSAGAGRRGLLAAVDGCGPDRCPPLRSCFARMGLVLRAT